MYIERVKEERKLYSKTYVEHTYTPLSYNEKQKFLEEMNLDSDKRLQKYSELFTQIKSQINYISDNINKSDKPSVMKIIEEKEEEYSPDIQIKRQKKQNRNNLIVKQLNEQNSITTESPNITTFTIQEMPEVIEEDKSKLLFPQVAYKSNHLQQLDLISNNKASGNSLSDNSNTLIENSDQNKLLFLNLDAYPKLIIMMILNPNVQI